jgi:hypothetical protein
MARLTAYGRTELVRMAKEESPDSELVSWRRKTVVLMSDLTVLEKQDVLFRRDGRRHSYGWKKLQRFPFPPSGPDVVRAAFVQKLTSLGFTEVTK